MKTTVFTKYHIAAGAKMAEFAGYNMPIEFTGINDEHMAVRGKAGVFDVSHMGEIWVKGPRALDLLQRITTNDVAKLYDGKVQYSCMPNGRGGIVDDILVYRIDEQTYMLCVNAANIGKDWAHICAEGAKMGMEAGPGKELYNASDEICQARRAGTAGDEDRAADVRRAGGGDGVLHLPEDAGGRVRRHPFRSRATRARAAARSMRPTKTATGCGRRCGRPAGSTACKISASGARHAAAGEGFLPLRQRHRRHDVADRGRAGVDHQVRRGQRVHRPCADGAPEGRRPRAPARGTEDGRARHSASRLPDRRAGRHGDRPRDLGHDVPPA